MIKDYLIKFKGQKLVELILNYCVVGIIGKKYNLKYFQTEKEARKMIENYKESDKFDTVLLIEKEEENYEIIYIYEN